MKGAVLYNIISVTRGDYSMTNRQRSSIVSKRITAILLTVICLLIAASPDVSADTGGSGYELVKYEADILVSKSHSYHISKVFTVNLPGDAEQLVLKIPRGNYRISDLNVGAGEYAIGEEGNFKTITITSPADIKKGRHEFEVTYLVEEYADQSPERDMFYFNVLPPDWEIPIGELDISLTFPSDFEWDDLQYFAGQFGAQDVKNQLSYSVSNNTLNMTGSNIPADFAITFKAELEDGYWQDELDNSWTGMFALMLTAVGILLLLLLWLIGGRDPKMARTEEKYPIDGVSPADVGFLFSGESRIGDIISLIIYLATKGCLRIVEYAPKKYKLIKGDEPKEEERFVRSVWHTLFDDIYTNRAVDMESLGPKLEQAMHNLELDIESGYSAPEMKSCTRLSRMLRTAGKVIMSICIGMIPALSNMHQYRSISYLTTAVVTALCYIFLSAIARVYDRRYDSDRKTVIALLAAAIAAYVAVIGYAAYNIASVTGSAVIGFAIMAIGSAATFFICIMPSRGTGNSRLVAKLFSLKYFMDKADPAEVARLQGEDSDYFYELLPYAFQFALIEKWCKKFRWMDIPRATWYSDEIGAAANAAPRRNMSTNELGREVNTFARTIESEYRTMGRGFRIFG